MNGHKTPEHPEKGPQTSEKKSIKGQKRDLEKSAKNGEILAQKLKETCSSKSSYNVQSVCRLFCACQEIIGYLCILPLTKHRQKLSILQKEYLIDLQTLKFVMDSFPRMSEFLCLR